MDSYIVIYILYYTFYTIRKRVWEIFFFRKFDGKCIFFFVFLGYFEKRCYFCNRLAEMASKAMAKSCCVIRLIQVRVFNCSERKGVLFPVSRGFGIESLSGHSVSDWFEEKNNRHGMDGKRIYTNRVPTKEQDSFRRKYCWCSNWYLHQSFCVDFFLKY